MPEGRIQMLTHHTEDTVWQTRWLGHPNGAIGLTSMTIVVADVNEAAMRFARFCSRAAKPSHLGQSIVLDRGRIDLMGTDEFARMLPQVSIPAVPFMGTYTVGVRSLSVVKAILGESGIATRPQGADLVALFLPELGHGAWVFTEHGPAG